SHQPPGDQTEDVEMAQKAPAPSTRPPVEETLYRHSGYDNLNGIAAKREQDVGRLQVAMHDASPMDRVQGLGQRPYQLGCLGGGQERGAEHVLQATAPTVLQRQVGQAVVF